MANDETISVKGVKKDLYDRIKDIARESGKTIGEITNDAYRLFLSASSTIKETGEQFIQGLKESQAMVISNIDYLEITGKEIVGYGKKVMFKNIGTLKIKEISEKEFEDYIDSIVNIKKLGVPGNINRLKVLERSRFIGEIFSI